ncbi:MAG: spore maturation protein, partial [Firmicutes bacterium]|nr:spore maturation protein [Bacillota bacterium]
MYEVVSEVSRWAIPLFILIVPLVAAARCVKVFETFVEGSDQGFAMSVKLIPDLVAMLVAFS